MYREVCPLSWLNSHPLFQPYRLVSAFTLIITLTATVRTYIMTIMVTAQLNFCEPQVINLEL